MKQKIYIGAAAILMAGIFLLAGGKPVAAKAEKIKKVKIASAEKTVLINKKEKIKLKAKVKPASMKKKVRWKSSNKKVVTVSQKGVIRGKRYGKANIWLKAADGSGKKAKIKVQVGRKVTSVSFAVKKQELEVGQKAGLCFFQGNRCGKRKRRSCDHSAKQRWNAKIRKLCYSVQGDDKEHNDQWRCHDEETGKREKFWNFRIDSAGKCVQ